MQSKEPITLDDTDDEEGAAPAGAAAGRLRRALRNNAYRGPADVFKVCCCHVMAQGILH